MTSLYPGNQNICSGSHLSGQTLFIFIFLLPLYSQPKNIHKESCAEEMMQLCPFFVLRWKMFQLEHKIPCNQTVIRQLWAISKMSPWLSQAVSRVTAFLCFVHAPQPLTRRPVCSAHQLEILPLVHGLVFIYTSLVPFLPKKKDFKRIWYLEQCFPHFIPCAVVASLPWVKGVHEYG